MNHLLRSLGVTAYLMVLIVVFVGWMLAVIFFYQKILQLDPLIGAPLAAITFMMPVIFFLVYTRRF